MQNDKPPLELLSDFVTEAHTRIQTDFLEINPVVSVSRKMRTVGIPADAMMIDCLKSRKRILIVLRDDRPSVLSYQFCMKDEDPAESFTELPLTNLSQNLLYTWMKEYFS